MSITFELIGNVSNTKSERITMSITVKNTTADEYFRRGRKLAKAVDAGERIEPSITISFENADEFALLLSEKRTRLVSVVRDNPGTVKEIAARVHRSCDAVAKDIYILTNAGILKKLKIKNPKHGVMNIIKPAANKIRLVAEI